MTDAGSSKSYFSLFVPSPSHASLLVPNQSFHHPYQRTDSAVSSGRLLTYAGHIKQYPFGGPQMEILYESTRKFGGSPFSIRPSRILIEELSGMGIPSAENFISDVNAKIISPLSFILKHYEIRMEQYDRFYYIMLITFLVLFIITFFIGGFIFVFLIYIAPLLKMRYMNRYDRNIKKRIRKILDEENEKLLKFGLEWVVYYKFKQTVANSIMIGHWMEVTTVQDVTIQLIRLGSVGSPDEYQDFTHVPPTPTTLTPTFLDSSFYSYSPHGASTAKILTVNAFTANTNTTNTTTTTSAKSSSPKTNIVTPVNSDEDACQEPPSITTGNSSPLFFPTRSSSLVTPYSEPPSSNIDTVTPFIATVEEVEEAEESDEEESPKHYGVNTKDVSNEVTPFIAKEVSNEVTPFVDLVD